MLPCKLLDQLYGFQRSESQLRSVCLILPSLILLNNSGSRRMWPFRDRDNLKTLRMETIMSTGQCYLNYTCAVCTVLLIKYIIIERGSERWKSEHWRVRTPKVFFGWSERQKSKDQNIKNRFVKKNVKSQRN
jgi:hypothetical protein